MENLPCGSSMLAAQVGEIESPLKLQKKECLTRSHAAENLTRQSIKFMENLKATRRKGFMSAFGFLLFMMADRQYSPALVFDCTNELTIQQIIHKFYSE